MSRWISFAVLLGVIVVIAAFFIRVMAEFLVPLFVATLLVVIFRPVHLWFLEKTQNRPAWAALLTTGTVILAVVLPFGLMLALAAAEGREIVKRFDKSQILQKLDDFRSTFGLNVTHFDQLTAVEETLSGIRESTQTVQSEQGLLSPRHFSVTERSELDGLLAKVLDDSQTLGTQHQLQWPPAVVKQVEPEAEDEESAVASDDKIGETQAEPAEQVSGDGETNLAEQSSTESDGEATESTEESGSTSFLQMPFTAFGADEKEDDGRAIGSTVLEQLWFNYVYQLRETQELVENKDWQADVSENRELEWQLRAAIANSHARFREFKVHLLGGPLVAWLKEFVNPQDDDIQQYSDTAFVLVQRNFLSWGGTATVFLGRVLFGGVIVLVSVYFFLLDGPAMMASVMQLSPMDDRHEQELINEFERVSRAVVLATLVAAVAQGFLAGFGFFVAGIQSVFLLTMLTMLLAMIPFFGAASVWVPVVLYIAFFENRPVAAFFLFLYCALIVSTIDNVIKPYILHGQSNLHPLLALLSVLGGVTALGAIGILVGPMLVAFLQTLLKILRDELVALDGSFQLPRRSAPSGSEADPGSEDNAPAHGLGGDLAMDVAIATSMEAPVDTKSNDSSSSKESSKKSDGGSSAKGTGKSRKRGKK